MTRKATVKRAVASVLKGCISDEEMYYVFEAKCRDFDIQPTAKLFERFLGHQAKKPFLKAFDMSCSAIGPESSLMAANLILLKPCLRVVNISGNSIGDAGARYFSILIQESKSLISLNLSSNSITDKGCEQIFLAMCDNKNIVSLNMGSDSGVGRNSFGNKACQALKKMLIENKVLSELEIAMTEITCDTIEIIAKGIRLNSTLEYLKVSNNNIQSKGVISLLKSCSKSKIKSLHMANNQIKDDIAIPFSTYLEKCRTIESIDLSGNYLTSKFIVGIVKQLKISTITSLNLNNNPLKGSGISSLGAALNGECRMRNLSFANCQVDSRGFGEFCDQISRNISLVSLHVDHNPILDEGAIRLSHVIKIHPSLKEIDLEQCEITEEGGSLLFPSFSISPSISRINVKNNLIKNGVLIQKCLTENPRIFYMNADFNTMDYKITVEIQRLVAENIKRWKSGQKARVKVKVDELYEVNLQLDETRQCIYQERQEIAYLRKMQDEMNEEEERIKLSMEATNDELQKKLDKLDKIVGDILLDSQSKKDDLRSIINQKENEISTLKNRLDNTTRKFERSSQTLENLEEKIRQIKSNQAIEEEDLRIRLANAQAKYKDMRSLLEEAWRRRKEEQKEIEESQQQSQTESMLESQSQSQSLADESNTKSKAKTRASKNASNSDSKASRKAENTDPKASKSSNRSKSNNDRNDRSNSVDSKTEKNDRKASSKTKSSKSKNAAKNDAGFDSVRTVENETDVVNSNDEDSNEKSEVHLEFSSSRTNRSQRSQSSKAASTRVNKVSSREDDSGDIGDAETERSVTSSAASIATISSKTIDTFRSKTSMATNSTSSFSISKNVLEPLVVDGENKGEFEFESNVLDANKKMARQTKPRSKSVQGTPAKRPKIVVPVPNTQKNKKIMNPPKPQVTFQNQIIP